MSGAVRQTFLPARDYDLAATLDCGQAFRWERRGDRWEGVIGPRWVRLRQAPEGILAEMADAAGPRDDQVPAWLEHYLQTAVNLDEILATFPAEERMRAAAGRCRGLRLLRQDPWECLASFLLSSTKQIVQIRRIVSTLAARYGEPLAVPIGAAPAFAFPTAARLAQCSEAELRACQMGFRAPHLLQAARAAADGELDLAALERLPLDQARERLLALRGVGCKIADCVLLFACGFPEAFPVDVWVRRALRRFYFPRRQPTDRRLRQFIADHFGPQAGYAQQYLFHYIRLTDRTSP